jgi:hypothetical protein
MLPTPPTSGGAPGEVVTIAAIPDSTWVLITVGGEVTGQTNPACGTLPPAWPCPAGPITSNFDSEPGTFGPVQLRAENWGAVKLRGTGGNTAIGLHFQDAAGSLSGWTQVNSLVAWNPNDGGGTPSYFLSGGYYVNVMQIASPLLLSEGPPADSLGTRTYTVGPLYGLKFSNPLDWGFYRPPGSVVWEFLPGDDVPETGTWSGPRWYLYECEYQTTCRWAPPRPGRMEAYAYVEGRGAFVRSGTRECQAPGQPSGLFADLIASGCGQDPALVLKCDDQTSVDTVTRGNRMKCVASSEPANASVTGLKWLYLDEESHTITGPEGALEWAGVMVVGGQVQVSAAVNGTPQAASLAVTVKSRDWTGMITFPPQPSEEWTKGPPLRYPPTIQGDTLADGTLGRTTYPLPEAASGFAEGTGPNEGWFFLDAPPYFSARQSHIYYNEALKPTDPFYRAQRGNGGGVVVMGKPACDQTFMAHAARHIPVHETGHYSRAKTLAESPAVAKMFEEAKVYGADPAADSTAYVTLFKAYFNADSVQQADWDRRSVLYVPCQLTVPTN